MRPIHFRSSSAPRPAPWRRPCSRPRPSAGSARFGARTCLGQLPRLAGVPGRSAEHAALRPALDAVAALGRLAAAAAVGRCSTIRRCARCSHAISTGAICSAASIAAICGRWRCAPPATTRPPRWPSSRRSSDLAALAAAAAHRRAAHSCGLDHLMASLGVPFLFPPVRLGDEYYGDGAQRQLWPLSPAIHLGADRLLVIGVRSELAAGITAAAAPRCASALARTAVRLHARHAVHGPDLRQYRARAASQPGGRSGAELRCRGCTRSRPC